MIARAIILLSSILLGSACGAEDADLDPDTDTNPDADTNTDTDTGQAATATTREFLGWQNPEDMASLPDGRYVIVSEYGDMLGQHPGSIAVLDLQTGSRRELYRGNTGTGPGPWGAENCPGPPTQAFSPHGLDLSRREPQTLQLLVVQHGERESVELFEVERTGDNWQLSWRGCVVAPEGSMLNDVVATPEGGFLVTHMMPRPGSIEDIDDPLATLGHVLAWHPEAGFSEQAGSKGPIPNGIELSADGRKIFLNLSGGELRRIDRGSGNIEASISLPAPDNSTWAPDGRLVVTAATPGVNMDDFNTCATVESGVCPLPFTISLIEPRSLAREVIYEGGPGTPSGAGTVGLFTENGHLLIGTFAGDRIIQVLNPLDGGF